VLDNKLIIFTCTKIKIIMKFLSFVILYVTIIFPCFAIDDPLTLTIGAKAPDFKLMNIDDKIYSLDDWKNSKYLLIVFSCNHCPTAQAYEDRLINFQKKYQSKSVQLIVISPNYDKAVRWDELGYSDLSDSFEEMKVRAKDKKYNFPYLYDGDTQSVTEAYGPTTTPHAFLFDENRILRYVGRIDDDERIGKARVFDLENALNNLLNNKEVEVKTTKTFGCSIKWKSKTDWKDKEVVSWSKEEVNLEKIGLANIKKSLFEKSTNYRLINFWATWCGPCVTEFSSLVETDKMYRNREFEMITVSLDAEAAYEKAHSFLKKKYASNKNYLFGDGNKYELIELVDSKWQGALPYTLLVDPDGQIVFRQSGLIDILALRKAIVDRIGRVYP
jgi:thiol-disulfide isomerase/thioredoxin